MQKKNHRRKLIEAGVGWAIAPRWLVPPLALTTLASGCGGGGGGSTAVSDSAAAQGSGDLTIKSASTMSPTAMTAVSLNTSGLVQGQAYEVNITFPSGYTQTLSSIRDTSDGKIVLATPFYIDPQTGKSASAEVAVAVKQGTRISNVIQMTIQDLPSVVSLGVQPGQISRAFLNYLTISLAQTINQLEALQTFPINKVNTTAARAQFKRQMVETIQMRGNVDRLTTGKQASLSIGKTPTGDVLQFDATSLDILDRVLAMHLAAIGYFPPLVAATSSAVIANGQLSGSFEVSAQPKFSIPNVSRLVDLLDTTDGVRNTLTGGFSALQPVTNENSHLDNVVAGFGAFASLAGLGAIVVGAPVVATAAIVAGLAVGGYQIARDIQNIAARGQGINGFTRSDAIKIAVDGFSAVSGPWGARGLLATLGAALVNGAANTLSTAFQGGSFISDQSPSASLNLADQALAESAAANARQSLGSVTGNISSLTGRDPLLSGPGGIAISGGNPNTTFTGVSDRNGNFSTSLPIGVLGIPNSTMQIGTVDLITGAPTSPSAPLDASRLTANSPIIVYPGSNSLSVTGDAVQYIGSTFTPRPVQASEITQVGPDCKYDLRTGAVIVCISNLLVSWSIPAFRGPGSAASLSLSFISGGVNPVAPGEPPFGVIANFFVSSFSSVPPFVNVAKVYRNECAQAAVTCPGGASAGISTDVRNRRVSFSNVRLTAEDGSTTFLNGALTY